MFCQCSVHKGKALRGTSYYKCKTRKKEEALQKEQAVIVARLASEEREAAVPSDDETDPASEENMRLGVEFANELLDQVVRKRIKPEGLSDLLKIFQRRYGQHLPEHIKIPRSWHMIKKLASDGTVPVSSLRHLCPECDWIFPLRGNSARCERCREDTRWEPNKLKRFVLCCVELCTIIYTF